MPGGGVIADRAYDSSDFRQIDRRRRHARRHPLQPLAQVPIPHDATLYKTRNRIERCFNKLKHFRRFATRYDRRAIHFLAFIHLAAAMIWMR